MKKRNFIKVKDLEHLKSLIENKNRHDYFIQLNFGVRSSKTIDYDNGKFQVTNEIDGSEQVLSDSEMMDESRTNIGKAINFGAFYCYNY
jgi:hypothetical protein